MKPVDEMSEAELDSLLMQDSKPVPVGKSVDEMDEDEIDSLLAQEQDSGPSALESGLIGASKAYTFGMRPQIETVLEGVLSPGRPITQALPGSEDYLKRRDEIIQEQEKTIGANPASGMAGQIVGAFLPSPMSAVSIAKGGSKLAQGAELAAKGVATSALMNPGDKEGEFGLQLEERLANTADFLTDPISLGLTAVPFLPAAKQALSDPKKATIAETIATKSLRPNMKDFRGLIGDSNVTIKDVGRYLIDNKLISPFKDLESVYDDLLARTKQTGGQIRDFYKNNTEKIAEHFAKNPNALNDYNQNSFNWLKEYTDARKKVAEQFANTGQRGKALKAVEDYFGDLYQGYKTPDNKIRKPHLDELSDIKTGLDNRINYEKEAKDTINEEVFRTLRKQISQSINRELDFMGNVLGSEAKKELSDLNRRFSIEKTAEKLANKAYAKGETSSDALYRAFGFGGGMLLGGGDVATGAAYGALGALAAPMARQAGLAVGNAGKRALPRALETLGTPTDIAGKVERAQGSMRYPYVEMTATEKAKQINLQRKQQKQQLGR